MANKKELRILKNKNIHMPKWADYLISAVRFEQTGTTKYISYLKVHVDRGEEITSSELWTKEAVISALDNGKTFRTIILGNNGWQPGKDVCKIWISNSYHLQIQPEKEFDNTDSMPTF
jgi:hypothetical protein